ncbi:hypothetical protein E8E11_008922 [Didymella keratinophila]|nr:hypothetical protein E8E11_008922 [Didymella keratinophila]
MKGPPPIRESLSARADPNKSSFLQLPGELRIKIYAFVFGAEEMRHVQYLPDKSYRSQGSSRSNDKSTINQEQFKSITSAKFSGTVWQYKKPPSRVEYRAHSNKSLSDMSTFVLIKLPPGIEVMSERQQRTLFISGSVQWLKKLGSQISLVENIVLDLDQVQTCTTFDKAYYGNGSIERFDVLPLMRFF